MMPLFSRFPLFVFWKPITSLVRGEAVTGNAEDKGKIRNRILTVLIYIGFAIMGIIVVALIIEIILLFLPEDYQNITLIKRFRAVTADDTLRNLIFAVGGVGGAIGLIFAKDRQEKFSDQVDTQIEQVKIQSDQSFNDKLGRGVELLANEKVSMRQAGLRVLDDLIKNTKDSHQKHIIANIIHDFVRDKARIRYEKDQDENESIEKVEKTEDRQDIALAVEILMQIHLDNQITLPFINNGKLNLTNLDFSDINFSNMTFKNVDFSDSHFVNTSYRESRSEQVSFYHAKLDQVNFASAKMKHTGFFNSVISDADFSRATIEVGYFGVTEIKHSKFESTQMVGCGCMMATVSIGDTSPDLIGCRSGNSDRFDYSEYPSNINKIDFSKCYFPIDKPPLIYVNQKLLDETDENIVDKTRGYVSEYDTDVFVESDKKWSRQPVYEWIDVEIAEWRIERVESHPHLFDEYRGSSENRDVLKKYLEAKKEDLEAKAEFDRKVKEGQGAANPD